jgi:predicted ribosomally synthesized peptide with SipW-like signal peptide
MRITRHLSIGQKLLLTAAIIGVAASVGSLGTFASFTSSTSASSTPATGTVTIALGATGASTNRLNIGATDVAPGDTLQRSFDLTNSGSIDLASVTLTSTASPSSLLDTDATNGLQMVIDRCSVAWTEAGVAPAYTYTCGGSTASVLASRAVIGSAIALANLGATTAGATDYLRLTLTLPGTAGNTFQNITSTITYAFTGTQRTATNK